MPLIKRAFEVVPATEAHFPHLAAYLESIEVFDVLSALETGEVRRASPWTGRPIVATGSLFLGKYHAYRLEEGRESALEVLYAGTPVLLLPRRGRVAHLLRKHGYPTELQRALRRLSAQWPRLSPEPPRSRAIFIGDTRPLHFMADCAAYIYRERSRLRAMPETPHVIQSPTMAFIGLDTLFGSLLDVTTLDVRGVQRYCRNNDVLLICGLRPQEPKRRVLRSFFDWLDGRFSDTALPAHVKVPKGALVVSIGLDIEKDRFVGQEEFVDLILARLHAFAAEKSRPLAVFWDGWTVKAEGRDAKDDDVISRLDSFAGKAQDRFGANKDVSFGKIYDLTLTQKIAFFENIDCFFATRGTASVVPGVLKGKPGFCYHNPVELRKKFPFSYRRAITLGASKAKFVSNDKDKPQHLRKYTFDLAQVPSIEAIFAPRRHRVGRSRTTAG